MIQRLGFWFVVSLITLAVSVSVIVVLGPVWGTDFTGGALLEFSIPAELEPSVARDKTTTLLSEQFGLASVAQTTENNTLLVRTQFIDQATYEKIVQSLQEQKLSQEMLRFETIGPTIGQELRRTSLLATALSLSAIVVYLTYTFRLVSRTIPSWKFGVAALYALVHDILFIVALFVILGRWKGVTIDTLFVTALLAISGYSINDTIVVFSRLQEMLKKSFGTKEGLAQKFDAAVRATLFRSLNTSFATLIVLAAITLFGGESIRWFVVALIAGIVVGTYSSIFVASPGLYFLSQWSWKKFRFT